MDLVCFCIAGHWMKLLMADATLLDRLLPSFLPFKCNDVTVDNAVCTVYVVEEPMDDDKPLSGRLLCKIPGVLGHCFSIMETETEYIVSIQLIENGVWHKMFSDKRFEVSRVYLSLNEKYAGSLLNSFLMFAFAQAAVLHQTFLVHASVIVRDGLGYAFLGKSGTGKSTHTALWQEYLSGMELLNDDNPAIRIGTDGKVYVYGSPWSGKKNCYKNRRAELKALVRLEQAPFNRFYQKEGVAAMITLLPSCSSMRWNNALYKALCDMLEVVIKQVLIASMDCLPNKEAAWLCCDEITKILNNK